MNGNGMNVPETHLETLSDHVQTVARIIFTDDGSAKTALSVESRAELIKAIVCLERHKNLLPSSHRKEVEYIVEEVRYRLSRRTDVASTE